MTADINVQLRGALRSQLRTSFGKPRNRSLGLLMLDSRFPRPLGDIGHPETFDFPVERLIVDGAAPSEIVCGEAMQFLAAFLAAARTLEQNGVGLISTSCGFLTLFQPDLSDEVSVPVVSSSLYLVPLLAEILGGYDRVGLLTISADSLTERHFHAAGIDVFIPVGSMQVGEEFSRVILGNQPTMDFTLARRDNVKAALALQKAHPNIACIVLECTNMHPYAQTIEAETGLPVFSLQTLLRDLIKG